VFLCTNGTTKLIDFGIARTPGSEKTLTQVGAVLGKPEYMSPEQAEGTLDSCNPQLAQRSDLYSLGIILFQMTCGHLPFTGENTLQILYQQVHKPLPPIPATIPRGMRSVIVRALQKRPEDRYKDANEMRVAVERVWQASLKPLQKRSGTALYRSAVNALRVRRNLKRGQKPSCEAPDLD
jgi:serine/threonine-protein kinase